MASEAARSAQGLLQAAPEDRVNQAGAYFVEAYDIGDEVQGVSPEANRIIGLLVTSVKPYSKSEPEPLNLAAFLGYCLRIGASRRGVPLPPADELGADLLPRSSSGRVDYETLHSEDQSWQDARGQVWDKVVALSKRTDIYGIDPPMWKFTVAAVTAGCDRSGKIARQVTLDDIGTLVSFGYVLAMLDEASGWDYSAPRDSQAGGAADPA
jgi:hypothetical protein